MLLVFSGVARVFPGGHPEDQNEEENEANLRKNERNQGKMRKCSYLAHPGEAGYGTAGFV